MYSLSTIQFSWGNTRYFLKSGRPDHGLVENTNSKRSISSERFQLPVQKFQRATG